MNRGQNITKSDGASVNDIEHRTDSSLVIVQKVGTSLVFTAWIKGGRGVGGDGKIDIHLDLLLSQFV